MAAKHAERKIDVLEQPLPRSLYCFPLRLSLLEVLFTFTLESRGCQRPPLRPIISRVVAYMAAQNTR